jgi:molecular chaperone DnaK (HSP70)
MVVRRSLSLVQTEKGITMRSSQGNNKEKQTGPKVKAKTQAKETPDSQRKNVELDATTTHTHASTIGQVVTEEQYRARVSQKAYELYQKRQAVTHLEDWLEAERLVKTELACPRTMGGSV